MWDKQWQVLAEHYRVIRFDLRGFGMSDVVKGPISRRADLLHVLKGLDITQATLVGCSLSGALILDFALEHPEMVSALVVVSAVPSGFEFKGSPPPQLGEMMEAVQKGDLALASELQNRIWVDGPFRESAQVDPEIRREAGEMNLIALKNGTFGKADAQPTDPLNPPAAVRLETLSQPTLIVAGGLDNPEILRAAEFMAGRLPNATKLIIPDCAHLPNMEKPLEFNQAVLNLLRANDSGRG
jgi:pimeloyl-ACP methyl ester carboxylesterase